MKATFTVANFNAHAGIDGWGRRFDAVGACCDMGADILVLEEDWVADDSVDSIGAVVANRLGYEIVSASSGRGRRLLTPDDAERLPTRWAPWRITNRPKSIRLDSDADSGRARLGTTKRAPGSTAGMWATSLISRFPILDKELISLPMLRGDRATRAAIVATIDIGASAPITLIGVHLGHLTHGSTRQMRLLRHRIAATRGPVILAGDLNCWGPPLRLFLRGVHDTVHGPTWPAWRPHSRIDHILTNEMSRVVAAQVLGPIGSDHLPISTTFTIDP